MSGARHEIGDLKRQPAEYSADEIDAGFDALSERLDRIEKAVSTMAWWLTQTPDAAEEMVCGKHEASATPSAFRDVLLAMARSVAGAVDE